MHAIHHIALGAYDVEGVARFYVEAFELPEIARHVDDDGALRSIWLQTGASVLMVERTRAPDVLVESIGKGPFLICFSTTSEERPMLVERLAAMGASLESQTAYSSYVRDPEGNRVAVSTHPVASNS